MSENGLPEGQSYEEMIGRGLFDRLEESEQEIVMQYFGERERMAAEGLDPEDEISWENQELRTWALEILGRIHGKFKGSMPKGEG